MQGIKFYILFIFFGIISSTLAFAEDKPNFLICRNQKNLRIVRIEKEAAGPHCVAKYAKSGISKEVGRALNINSCIKIMENIKINLEKSSWKCKETTNTTITSTVGE